MEDPQTGLNDVKLEKQMEDFLKDGLGQHRQNRS